MRDVRTGYYNTLEKERKNVGQASYLALSEPQIIKGSTEKRPQILVAVQEKGDVNTAWMLADHLYPTASKEEIIKAAGGSSEKKPALTAKLPLSPLLSPLPTSPTKEAIVKKMDVKPAAKK